MWGQSCKIRTSSSLSCRPLACLNPSNAANMGISSNIRCWISTFFNNTCQVRCIIRTKYPFTLRSCLLVVKVVCKFTVPESPCCSLRATKSQWDLRHSWRRSAGTWPFHLVLANLSCGVLIVSLHVPCANQRTKGAEVPKGFVLPLLRLLAFALLVLVLVVSSLFPLVMDCNLLKGLALSTAWRRGNVVITAKSTRVPLLGRRAMMIDY